MRKKGQCRLSRAVHMAALLLAALLLAACASPVQQPVDSSTFAMDTMITQRVYGAGAQQATQELNRAFAAWEARLSLFKDGSDIARINAGAGGAGAEVTSETVALLRQALALSAQSDGAFAVTVAPLTLAWGITGDAPRVPPQAEIDALLPLVDDGLVKIEGNHVTLPLAGMALDLGGIAKGAACEEAKRVYDEYNVKSAFVSIGGNIYARGTKPDGSSWRFGFQNPNAEGGSAYIASFALEDQVIAVSGGYERFFEQDGRRYIHIIDPQTGYPAESDIASVGVICADGAEADFWSTTLFLWGRDKALDYMRGGGCAILLDEDGVLYASETLKDSLRLHEEAGGIRLEFVAGG